MTTDTQPQRFILTVLANSLQPHPIGKDLWASSLTRQTLSDETNQWIATYIPEWDGKGPGDGRTWILVTDADYSSGDVTHVREIRTIALQESGRYAFV